MESTSSRISVPNPSRQPCKRLLFDRRYGWVIDEWKDPSEEALEGGRGMFCILPLAKALVQKASQSINLTAESAIKVFKDPQLFSPEMLQAGLNDNIQTFISSLKSLGWKGIIPNKNRLSHDSNCSSRSHVESNEFPHE